MVILYREEAIELSLKYCQDFRAGIIEETFMLPSAEYDDKDEKDVGLL